MLVILAYINFLSQVTDNQLRYTPKLHALLLIACTLANSVHAADEIIQIKKLESNDGVRQVLKANMFLQLGDKVNAGKIFKNLADGRDTNVVLQNYAVTNYEKILNSHVPYSFGIQITPDLTDRKYKSDTLNIRINNEDFAFTVQRSKELSEVVALRQAYRFWLWPHLENGLLDELIVHHRLIKFSDHSLGNEIGFRLKRTDLLKTRTDTVEFTTKKMNNGSNNIEYSLGLTSDFRYSKNRLTAHLDHHGYKGSAYPYDKAYSAQIGYGRAIGAFELALKATRNVFSVNDFNNKVLTAEGSKLLSRLGTKVSVKLENRYDDRIKFPTNVLRKDTNVSMSLNKKLTVGKWSTLATFTVARNRSNVLIYSYDEVSLGLNYILN